MINDDQRDANQKPTQLLSVPNQNETNAVGPTSLSRFTRQRFFADFEPPLYAGGGGRKGWKIPTIVWASGSPLMTFKKSVLASLR